MIEQIKQELQEAEAAFAEHERSLGPWWPARDEDGRRIYELRQRLASLESEALSQEIEDLRAAIAEAERVIEVESARWEAANEARQDARAAMTEAGQKRDAAFAAKRDAMQRLRDLGAA